MKLGLGLGINNGGRGLAPVIDIDFTKISAIPSEWSYTRSSAALGRDADGFFTSLNSGEPDLRDNEGIVLYPEYEVKNHYTRPSSGSVTDHFLEYFLDDGSSTTGPFTDISSVVSTATDTGNPGKNLSPNGDTVWEVDNTGGNDKITLVLAGNAGNGNGHSAFFYAKVLEGGDPELEFAKNSAGDAFTRKYFENGYIRLEAENQTADSDTALGVQIQAGSHVYFTMANFQETGVIMPGFDTIGSSATVSASSLASTNTALIDKISTEGTFVFDWTTQHAENDTALPFSRGIMPFLSVTENSVNDFFWVLIRQETFELLSYDGGAETEVLLGDENTPEPGETEQIAFAYNTDDLEVVMNGTSLASLTSYSVPDVSQFTSINFGRDPNWGSFEQYPMQVRRLRYFDKRLSNSTLKRLTDLSEHLFVAGAGQSLMEDWSTENNDQGEVGLLRALKDGGGVPEFVNGATGGSALLEESGSTDYWFNLNDTTGNSYTSFDNSLTSSVSDTREDTIDFIIWQQGSSDIAAFDNGTYTGAQYEAALNTLFDQFKADYGDQIRFVIGIYGRWTAAPGQAAAQTLRDAQKSIIDSRSDTFFGCEIYDLELEDDIHLTGDAMEEHGRRMGARINAVAGRLPEQGTLGPSIAEATYNDTHIDITISHDAGDDLVAGPYDAGLFRVEDDGSTVTVNSVSKTGSASVRLVLDSSIASGSDVKLWHVYGSLPSITGTFIKDNAGNPLPLQSVAELDVSEG